MDSGRYTLNSTANSSRQSMSSTGRLSSSKANSQHLHVSTNGYLHTNRVKAFLGTVQERDNSR